VVVALSFTLSRTSATSVRAMVDSSRHRVTVESLP